MYDVRLADFTNPHIRLGDLHVERNQTIGSNLDICGNLTLGGDLRARNYYASGNFYLNNFVLIPAGTIIQSAATNVPGGWLDCNGETLSVAMYSYLFSAISYTYGGADLSFNIPDMRGRVGIGAGDGVGVALTPRGLGAIGGEENHTLVVGEMPQHSHSSNANGFNTENGCGLIVFDGKKTLTAGTVSPTDNTNSEPNVYDSPIALIIDPSGSSLPHNNMQPFLVLRYLIKY
jgi:microcystin-dependent protein